MRGVIRRKPSIEALAAKDEAWFRVPRMAIVDSLVSAAWTIALVVLGVGAVVGVTLFLPNRHRGLEAHDFAVFLRKFMGSSDVGASCAFRHAGEPLAVVRVVLKSSAHDNSCNLAVDASRTTFAESNLDRLQQRFAHRGFTIPAEELSVLLRIDVHVPNIWHPDSGSAAARVALEMFDALGLAGPEHRYDFDRTGPVTLRKLRAVGFDAG